MREILKHEAPLPLSEGQIETFCRFGEALLEQNKVMNLTAITEPGAVARLCSFGCFRGGTDRLVIYHTLFRGGVEYHG